MFSWNKRNKEAKPTKIILIGTKDQRCQPTSLQGFKVWAHQNPRFDYPGSKTNNPYSIDWKCGILL